MAARDSESRLGSSLPQAELQPHKAASLARAQATQAQGAAAMVVAATHPSFETGRHLGPRQAQDIGPIIFLKNYYF